ncbi:MAG: AarF/ABC1/UbiB kinase family protein [Deltaproteobacteria bacterium]|nr:AarF/ABC1/UbiB kinase family protein [Deltaproteobacteria bacterium]
MLISIRKIGVIGRTYRHLTRYRQILTVLFKYGFENLVEHIKIEQYIELGLQMISRKPRARVAKLSRSERIRMMFEELGPTYIKLAQILSTRPDLIPVDLLTELAKLQDKVPSFPFSDVQDIIFKERGQTITDLFETIDEVPIASASIGQVHRARLKNGEEVAIKIQRPGIRKIIEVDLEIMLHLATLAERNIEELTPQRPVKIVEEFARTLEKELDYSIEATNMERMAAQFLDDQTLYIPKVFRDFSTKRILTMEFVEGIKISDIQKLNEAGLDCKKIIARGSDILLKQIFDHGFFHADPHPGNIFVLPNNVICLLDFGMTGSVGRHTREDFVDLIDSVMHQDEINTTHALLTMTTYEQEPKRRLLEKDVADFMGRHLYKALKDIEVGKLLQHLLELAARHRLSIPPDIFLMMKALGSIEGVGLMLDPEFDMIAQATPFIKRIKMTRFEPHRIAGDIMRLTAETLEFLQQFPKDMLEITRMIRERKFYLKHEIQDLDTMLATHDQISNRISFSIIIAALLIGSALIVISKTPPLFYGISLIGIIGFTAAAVMGIWLLIAILKKGRL